MKRKHHVLVNIFIYHRGMLKQYGNLLQVGFETEKHFSLLCPNGQVFAAIELRPLSVAWHINISMIKDFEQLPRTLAGLQDKEGWFHFSNNQKVYKTCIKELLNRVYHSLRYSG